MGETLHQPLTGRRFQRSALRLTFLLVLPAAGFGLLAITREIASQRSEPRPPGSDGGNHSSTASAPLASLQEILAHPDPIPSHNHPLLGRQAPDFALADHEGKVWSLRDLRAGGSLVLIFYYGYHCPNCARQLRSVNRDLPLLRKVGARVVAVSADPPELTRRRFQQHGRFEFLVLSDPGNKVAHAYQVFKASYLRHGTFLIDRDSNIAWVNVGDAPFRRSSALLTQLARMPVVRPAHRGENAR